MRCRVRPAWVLLSFALPACGGDLFAPSVLTRASPLAAVCEAEVEGRGRLDVEDDYLPHVVACENGAADPAALRAQAIAARSYLYSELEASGVIEDGQQDQVYTCGREPDDQHRAAVRATSGQVLRYGGAVIAAFYVAGAVPERDDCVAAPGDADRFDTERFVTYNRGRAGAQLIQTRLGWVNPKNLQNRGAQSQNGAQCLAKTRGASQAEIVGFYYGFDIEIAPTEGACVRAGGASSCVAARDQDLAFDEAGPCFTATCEGEDRWIALEEGFGGRSLAAPAEDEARCTGRWSFEVEEAGTYALSVFMPSSSVVASRAEYRVLHAGLEDVVVVDPAAAGEALETPGWIALGSFAFTAGGGQGVELTDRAPSAGGEGQVVFDALRIRREGVAPLTPIGPLETSTGASAGEGASCACATAPPVEGEGRSGRDAAVALFLALAGWCARQSLRAPLRSRSTSAAGATHPLV